MTAICALQRKYDPLIPQISSVRYEPTRLIFLISRNDQSLNHAWRDFQAGCKADANEPLNDLGLTGAAHMSAETSAAARPCEIRDFRAWLDSVPRDVALAWHTRQ